MNWLLWVPLAGFALSLVCLLAGEIRMHLIERRWWYDE